MMIGLPLLAYLADGDYQQTRAKYEPADLLAGLVRRYGGTAAEVYAEELEDIERRLDREWPGWRDKQPYGGLPVDAWKRIKLLLTRRRLILIGKGAWGLKLIQRLDGRVVAVQVRPAYAAQVHAREPEFSVDPKTPKISIPFLAVKAGVTLEHAEAAMAAFDPAAEPNQLQHIKDWCAANPEATNAAAQ